MTHKTLRNDNLDFLIDETRRREDILDDTLDVVTRKAYYVFTLATTVFGVYLTGMRDYLADSQQGDWSVKFGFCGLAFYAMGAWMFSRGHSAHNYIRVPTPERLYQEFNDTEPNIRIMTSRRRAKELIANLSAVDTIARIVNIQHDFLLWQIGTLALSWLLTQVGM